VAIDGSRFKAVNSRERNCKLERKLGEIEQRIEGYLKELDEADQQEPEVSKPTAEELKEKIERMRGRRAQLQALGRQLEGSGES
jgi:hypothetical protein